MRTHMCGELDIASVGQTVSLCGWVARRREHGEHLAFVDIRDHSGIMQCVVDNDVDVRSEYVIRVTGVVRARPEGTVNTSLTTGMVEIGDCVVEILNSAEPPPFPVDARADDVDEMIRLKYRYLDIRRERMQKNLRVRAQINSAIRTEMETNGFVEVETPFLMPSTPEGAREFLVPSRKEPGSFFALPQYAADGAGAVWHTADAIWAALGDTSRDVNWYTKRMTLGAVYSACVLFWLGDESPDMADTRAFIDRRIDDVMRFEKVKAQAKGLVAKLPSVAAIAGLCAQGVTDTIFFRPEVQLSGWFCIATLAAGASRAEGRG